MADLTPMMRQYLEIKEQNKDSILFFRLGDFYEMFNEDAKLAARELDLVLTTRDRGKSAEEQTPMCGIPYHSSDGYIARLIAKGYKVAICEQTEDPALAKGLVKRDIIRVVTPGTVIDSACLDDRRGNFLCGVFLDEQNAGVAFCDMSTGHTHVTAFSGADRAEHLCNELARFSPAEAVLSAGAYADEELKALLADRLSCRVERGEARFDLKSAEKAVLAQYGEDAYASLPRNNPAAALALGGLLSYLHETQKSDLSYISDLEYYEQGRFMELDLSARRNLELTETIRGKEKRGSLLWVLDKTKTAMGARCLRSWLERPLREVAAITRRSNAVGALVNDTMAREELVLALSGISDMERLIGRIVYGTAGGRDLVSLRNSIEQLAAVREQLAHFTTGRLGELSQELDPLADIAARIAETIVDEPPFSVREGGFIRKGFNAEVDRLHDILSGGKGLLASIETKEKERTGIRTLKIGYNKVFGYYIEVSNSFKDQVPDTYIRKQTLVNGERYITQELKDLEQEILTAGERDNALEYEIFSALRDEICAGAERIQKTAAAVAELDTLASLAVVAVKNSYCCPVVDDSGVIEIHDGRHPVVERVLKDALFVPNDTYMGEKENRVAIITGPNMAGKSTYMRSRPRRPHRRGGPHLHPYRRERRPGRRPVHLHGRNERGRGNPAAGDGALAADLRRDRPRHLDLRRHEHRPRGARVLRRPQKARRENALRHPLPRAHRAGGHARGREKLQHRHQKARGGPCIPPQDHSRRSRPQLRHRGRQARGTAEGGRLPREENTGGAGGRRQLYPAARGARAGKS